MAQPDMPKLPLRLLLNAEPFGFGPTAAIAAFFPHLKPYFESIGYVGKRHTLDLQRDLPYDAVHDVSAMGREERADTLAPIFSQYDILLTAMDHKVGELAKEAGLKVFYYDALAWYWPEIPESVRNCDLYLAQDFFGVQERLAQTFNNAAAECVVVPPIVPRVQPQAKTHTLINLGGLQNPYWPVESAIEYADAIISSLRSILPADEEIVIAGSRAIEKKLAHTGLKTYNRDEMEHILAASKAAFMTPGLGNIYDAAAFNIPTVWLPPANDSQGQQLRLLQEHDLQDGALDWAEITDDIIDYKAVQSDVLTQIAAAADTFTSHITAQTQFAFHAAAHFSMLGQDSKTRALIDRFGTGGEAQVAAAVVHAAQNSVGRKLRHG